MLFKEEQMQVILKYGAKTKDEYSTLLIRLALHLTSKTDMFLIGKWFDYKPMYTNCMKWKTSDGGELEETLLGIIIDCAYDDIDEIMELMNFDPLKINEMCCEYDNSFECELLGYLFDDELGGR